MQIDGLVHPHQHLRNNLPNNDNNIFDNKSQSPQRGVGASVNDNTDNTSNFPIFFLSSPSKVAGDTQPSSSSSPIKSPASQPRADSSSSSQRDASPHPRIPTNMMDGGEKVCTNADTSSVIVDNKEASLAAAEAAAKKLSTTTQQQQEHNENSVDNKQVLMGMDQNNNNNTSTSLPRFFTSAVENISWFLDLLNRYPLTSLCTVAIVSRLVYRLRLFSINHIHNCLPWVRFGSEVAATGGWVKLAWTNQSSIRSLFSTTSAAAAEGTTDTTSTSIVLQQHQRRWYSMSNVRNWFETNFIPIFNSLFGFSSFFSSNKNSNQQQNDHFINSHHIVFDDDVSPIRDDPLRAASASLAPGERRQLRSLYVKVRSTCTTSIEDVEEHEQQALQQQEETFSARRRRRQQQARIDVAKVALIEKFKSLPEEWRKQVSEISDSHWQMYAMSLGVIPQWDHDLMNQLREAILFRPCPAGWKMHLFADELIRHRHTNDDATTTNQPQHHQQEEHDEEIVEDEDEDDAEEDIGSRNNINTRKPIKGGIRFVDTRVEAPHPFHSDNQFTIESIRAEALRRLQQQPNRRRQLVDLIQEMSAVRSVHDTNDAHDVNNNYNNNNNIVRSAAPSASPVAFIPSSYRNDDSNQHQHEHDPNSTIVFPASLSCSPANHHNTTIVNPFTITVTGDDDGNNIHHQNHSEDAAAFLLHNEDASGMFLHSSERVLEQLQTAAAESPQRLRSELMKRACSVKAGTTPRTTSVCNFALQNQPSASPCHNQYLTFSSPTSGEQYYQNEFNASSSVLPLPNGKSLQREDDGDDNDDNDADMTVVNGNNTTVIRDEDLRRPVEFDLTSPTRRQIQETLEETRTAQSVDDLLQMFMTPTARQQQQQQRQQQQQTSFEEHAPQSTHSNTAVDLFSNAIRDSECQQDSNNTNAAVAAAERYCRKMNSNESEDAEDEGGDYIAPAATPRNNELSQNPQPPNAQAPRKSGVVFSSSGKFSVSATPRNR